MWALPRSGEGCPGAHEGSEHAGRVEQRGIGEATLEQFRADVTSLSVHYLTGETFALFMDMRRVRNRVLEALDRRQWRRDAAELYLLAGCLSALMAAAAVSLGYPQAAEELTGPAGPTRRSSITGR